MSRQRHDSFSKDAFALWLAPLGDVALNVPLTAETRLADALFTEQREAPKVRRALGWLGELARGLVLLEHFRNPPSLDDMQSCAAKGFELRARVRRRGRQQGERASAVASPVVLVVVPELSAEQRRRYRLVATRRAGVYELGPVVGLVLVVVDELPDGEATLRLRLLGRGEVQRRAIGQLLAMGPDGDWRDATLRLLTVWRQKQTSRHELTSEERAEMSNWEAAYEKWEKKTLAKGEARGKAEGKAEGLRVAISDLCEVLGVKLGRARQAQLASLDLAGLEGLRAHLKQHHAWPSAEATGEPARRPARRSA